MIATNLHLLASMWPPAVEAIGWLLVHSLWQFAVVALVALLANRLLRSRAASTRYAMLLAAMLLIVAAPIVTWSILSPIGARAQSDVTTPIEEFPAADSAITVAAPAEDAMVPPPGESPPANQRPREPESPSDAASTPTPAAPAIPWSTRLAQLVEPWLNTIVILWCFGVVLFSIRPAWSWLIVHRLRSIGVSPVGNAINHMIQRLEQRLHMTRRIQVLQSTLVETPVVVGCIRCVILLPVSFVSGVPEQQLEAILAHELAHVRRYDCFINLLQTLVETLFFYHPAVWWLSHRIRIERENCCDDLAVAALGDRVQYGRALLAIEEYRASAGMLALGARDGSLTARIRRLFGDNTRVDYRAARGLLWTSLLATTCAAAMIWSHVSVGAPAPAAESKKDEPIQIAAPFRLPDHWIMEDVIFTDNGKQIVTLSIQGGVNVRRWDLAGRKLISEIKLAADVHGRAVRQDTLQFSAEGTRIIAATDDYVGIWDAATGDLLKQFTIPKKQWEYDCVRCLDCSRDLSVLVAGLGTSYLRTTQIYNGYGIVWNVASGEVTTTVTHEAGFYFGDVTMSPDGKRFATRNEHGGSVCIWDATTGKLLHDLSQDDKDWPSPDPELIKNHLVQSVQFSPDGKLLAVTSTYGVRLVDAASGRELRRINAPYRFGSAQLVFSGDGRRFARFGARKVVPIWSTQSGEKLYELETPADTGALSPDGRLVAIGESDFYEALSIWPLADQTVMKLDNPPAAYPRINRVDENTHHRGEKAAQFVNRWNPVWGQAQHGIEYGIAFTVPANRFHPGERVLMAAFLRNAGDQPLQFDLRPDMFGNPPQVRNSDGEVIRIETRPLLGQMAHYRDTLQPGEAFGPLYLNFGLGENPRPGLQNWEPCWKTPTPGKYKLTHHVSFKVASPNASPDATSSDWTDGTLFSGPLTFEVDSAQNDNAPQATQPKANDRNNPGHADAVDPKKPWRVCGRVLDQHGNPLKGVTVRAATGRGTLLGGGTGVTDADGQYDFSFGMGVRFANSKDGEPSPQTQFALISARLDGYFEQNFDRQGDGIGSLAPLSEKDLKSWGVTADQVCLPGKPREVNFVMLSAAHVVGTLIDENDRPLKDYSVSLTGDQLPPGSSVLAQVITDEQGRFRIDNIPTTVAFQFRIRKPHAEFTPPWDDSWAGPPIKFADPDDADFRTVLKTSDSLPLIVKSLRLKIVGPGVHSKTAVRGAAKRTLPVDSDQLTFEKDPFRYTMDQLTLLLSNDENQTKNKKNNAN